MCVRAFMLVHRSQLIFASHIHTHTLTHTHTHTFTHTHTHARSQVNARFRVDLLAEGLITKLF